MKDTFHGWAMMSGYPLDTVVDYILTGRKATEAKPDVWMFRLIGSKQDSIRVMDFGCGIGRNTFGLANYSPKWNVVGYDNDGMLGRIDEYYKLHYPAPFPSNVSFSSSWDKLKQEKFDAIVCCLVLQHIHENALVQYINDFKSMTKTLMVTGRRVNDDIKGRSTWTILQENGLTPVRFLQGLNEVPYNPNGSPEDHNTAIYVL